MDSLRTKYSSALRSAGRVLVADGIMSPLLFRVFGHCGRRFVRHVTGQNRVMARRGHPVEWGASRHFGGFR